jgi:hypothetical protein
MTERKTQRKKNSKKEWQKGRKGRQVKSESWCFQFFSSGRKPSTITTRRLPPRYVWCCPTMSLVRIPPVVNFPEFFRDFLGKIRGMRGQVSCSIIFVRCWHINTQNKIGF